MPRPIQIMATFATWLVSATAAGQQARLDIQEAPYHVGEPVLIRITTADFDKTPQPTCEPGVLPAGLSVDLVRADSNQRIFQTVINGRVTTRQERDFQFDFHAVAEKHGIYRVPPFVVTQGNKTARTGPLNLKVQEITLDANMRVVLHLPSDVVYPGQRVPVTIEWWYAGDSDDVRYETTLNIRSPLFHLFSFIDQPVRHDEVSLPIMTSEGRVALKADVSNRTLDGRVFLVVSASHLMEVNEPGEHELAPITATVEKVTRWGRDFFGRSRPLATTRIRAIGKSQKLVVQPLPLDEAPPSFAGAVGRGFTMDLKADRSVVRVGDPITLTITLRGEGNLERIGLPKLSIVAHAGGGELDDNYFRLPSDEVAGELLPDGAGKMFAITVRVLDQTVSEIPPIAYSWFDPQREVFDTTYSSPIALRVLPTQVVGASDVVSGSPEPSPRQTADPTPAPAAGDSGTTTMHLDFAGADLAIETSAAHLLVDESQQFGGVLVRRGIYIVSILVMLTAWLWRRTVEMDPQVMARRKLLKEQAKQISQASRFPRQQAAGQIAAALRQIEAHTDGDERGQIDRLLAECDVLAYAPNADGTQQIDAGLHERAMSMARMIAQR